MVPTTGVEGTSLTTTFVLRDVLVPHAFLAATEITPPLMSAVTLIDVIVEVPDHPDGMDQTYEEAPGTSDILYI